LLKVVSIEELYPVFSEKLQSGGSFILTVTGNSMFPLFRHGLDSIEVFPAPDKLKKNDMPLYRRDAGQFVMHRIVGFDGNGDYILCGASYSKICMYTLESFQATAVMFEIRKPLAIT
jgi:hypothetical protein